MSDFPTSADVYRIPAVVTRDAYGDQDDAYAFFDQIYLHLQTDRFRTQEGSPGYEYGYKAYADPTPTVQEDDRLYIGGNTYDVDAVEPVYDMDGVLHHQRVSLSLLER